ncbi:MAG: gliding motility-associated C-terminal domain-containing protein [Chitinophagales bacterium]
MRNKILLLATFILFFIGSSYAQNYQFNSLGNNSTTTTCKGTFTASGTYQGTGTYNNNTNKSITFCSGTPGVPIRISFIDWDLESGYDYLRIYDGVGTGGTLLGTINGSSDIYTSGALFFTSTGTCLTVQLTSDGSVTGYWDAIVGCAPQNCGTNLPANDACGAAPQICDLNGYCGNTSGWYTADNQQIDNTVGNSLFCGSIENNSWLTFVASATTATLNVNSTNCAVSGTGIQAQVFSTTNCSSFTSKSNCVSQSTGNGAFTLTATGLTVGTRYYVMIDGYAGNICDYTVTANTGVQVLSFTSSASANQICEGQQATITVNGAISGSTYSWSASPAGSIIGATNGASITVNPTVTTVYSVTVTQPNGCLTQTENFTLTVNPKKFTTIDRTICQGESVTVCGQSYSDQGSFTKVCTSSKGCDSTVTLNLTVLQGTTPTFNTYGPYCIGATPGTLPGTSNNGITGTWNPATISTATAGTTTYTFTPTAGQCATTATISVTVNQNITPTFNAFGPYCVGATPGTLPGTSNNGITGTWNPATISTATAGTTTYTFTPTAGQCATTASISVTVNQNITPTFNAFGPYCVGAIPGVLPGTANNGITGTWNPATISTATAGSTTYTFTPTSGQCATTATISVTVNQNITPTFNVFGPYCVGATPGSLPGTSNNGITGTWNPATISTATAGSTTYTFTPTAGQCATTASITITVGTNITPTFNTFGPYCQNSRPGTLPGTSNNGISGTWNPASISTTNAGTTSYTFTPTAGQCATTATISVNVNPTKTTLLRDTICEGDSIIVGNQTFYTQGSFTVPLLTSQNCDSIVTLDLFVNPKKVRNLSQVFCEGDSIVIGTSVFKESGDYTVTLQTSAGCDSIINLNLTVLDTSVNTFVTTICAGESVTIGNQTFTEEGIYTVRLQSSYGCDSTIILDLRIKPTQTTNLSRVICQGESVTVGNQTFSSNGIFTVKLQTYQSCDSTVILDLTVNPISRTVLSETICDGDSIVIGDQSFNSSGTYTVTLRNATGCDSIISLNLFVNPVYETNITKTICQGQSETIGNQVFTESGNFSVRLQSSAGCDSTVNLNLTVLEPVVTNLDRRICQGEAVIVGDTIYNTNGQYTRTLVSASGCDSIVTLNLLVDPKVSTNLTNTICDGDSVTVGNQTFKITGVYVVVLQSAAGCDSTVNLDLKVNTVTRTSLTKNICAGESYTVGQETFNETGEFTVHLQSVSGCDSTVLLNLTVNNLPAIDAVADKPVVIIGEQVQLNVTTAESLSYNWAPADIVNNAEIQNPTAVLSESTWFVVTATNGQTGCSFTDSVYVELNELTCSKENVFIPNAFTPNGDGINDIFIPRSSILKSMKLIVVDRWGNQVFESTDINVGWDGIYKGQPATVDSYGYYFVGECSQGEKITIKGNVSLLR